MARNLPILRKVIAKVLVVEEAAEVLEAHILTAMLPALEHLILIGDHQQLRPHVNTFTLSRESREGQRYSLDLSLFERLVTPGQTLIPIPYDTLSIQRRMHPSISRLIRSTLYPNLVDDATVLNHPPVLGMASRLYWLDHEYPENSRDDSGFQTTSYSNAFEVDFVVGLVSHLVRQGIYQAGDIAVITPYLGQPLRLRTVLSKSYEIVLGDRDELLLEELSTEASPAESMPIPVQRRSLAKTVRLATVDNFQGEEAKIVIISMVRSNVKGTCGFLRTTNRVNVLLSRAQHGLYIIGNATTASSVPVWRQVLEMLSDDDQIGTSIELQCPRHPHDLIPISTPDDFIKRSPEGGCVTMCTWRLHCGHACNHACHAETLHDAVVCLEVCKRSLKGCTHACPNACGRACPEKCKELVTDVNIVLSCGHAYTQLPCFEAQDPSRIQCEELTEAIVAGCQHRLSVQCHKISNLAAERYTCMATCSAALACGHDCTRPCTECNRRSSRNGQIPIRTDHGKCSTKCGRSFSTCDHVCTAICHGSDSCPPCTMDCLTRCAHSRCSKPCAEPCAPCAESICTSRCAHSACTMPCAAPCDWIPCHQRCSSVLDCGHQCPSACGEVCPSSLYCLQCCSDSIKTSVVDLIMMTTYDEHDLDDEPLIFLECGHFFATSTLDGHVSMSDHFEIENGIILAIKESSHPFSEQDIKSCPTCRAPITSIHRYGRLTRRAMIDRATKRMITWSQADLVKLQAEFLSMELGLQEADKLVINIDQLDEKETLKRKSDKGAIIGLITSIPIMQKRYDTLLKLHRATSRLITRVRAFEQPFSKVYDLVLYPRRSGQTQGSIAKEVYSIETAQELKARLLRTHIELCLLEDLAKCLGVNIHGFRLNSMHTEVDSNLARAGKGERYQSMVEFMLCKARIYILELHGPDTKDDLRGLLKDGLKLARSICDAKPSCQRLLPLVDKVQAQFDGVYRRLTKEEVASILAAMQQEFRPTGHWYTCANGHPFTIGECGMPMQQLRCPECGAAIGGHSHTTAAGVRSIDASNLEQRLQQLALDRS